MKKSILIITATILITISCSKGSGDGGGGGNGGGGGGGGTVNCTGVPVSFSANVNPIIQSTCATDASCHGTGSFNGPGALKAYNQIFDARTNIRSAVLSGSMPKTGTLTTAQKNSIICWIDSGAPNN